MRRSHLLPKGPQGNQASAGSLHDPRRPKRAAASAVTSYDEDDPMAMAKLRGECLSQSEIAGINALEIEEGDVIVHRAPVLACLEVPPEVVLKRPFKPPIPAGWSMPPDQCGLGMHNKGRGRLGMSGNRRPPSSFGEYRSVSKEELAAAMEDEEQFPGYDPCILWSADDDESSAVSDSPPQSLAVSEDGGGVPGVAMLTLTKRKPKPIVVAPFIGRFLREHQREGVRFVFECVSGLRPYQGKGCILADDMGLGKTLQSITLLYTLLRKGMDGKPTCRRIIVVTPTSLVRNWDNELTKWLGGRVRSVALADSDRKKAIKLIKRFVCGAYEVMIISYETFRIHSALFEGEGVCDLLICDEAHRLKNDATLTAQALDKLRCPRRILLSGTPMQNDLEEFFAMVNFCNPGILGTVNDFRKKYQNPILAGREPDAGQADVKKSTERSAQLSEIVNNFILRRTNTLLAKHLPPKLTQIVCVAMTEMQKQMYEQVAASTRVSDDGPKRGKEYGATALNAINALKKICNHPQLMYRTEAKFREKCAGVKASGEDQIMESLKPFFPDNFGAGGSSHGAMRSSKRLNASRDEDGDDDDRGEGVSSSDFENATCRSSNMEWSGKFMLMANMLEIMRKETDDRIVIVSNYTQTLDLFEMLCKECNYPFVRLDGSTSSKKRQGLVDRLNNPKDNVFVFLLSSKAGGCGLNLIGANRLVLFDPDWNPATDKQAAARVWRDGAKKRCYVYRFVATGTIEEKIYQRQLSKEGLQNLIADDKDLESTLSTAQLKELFSYRHGLVSDTHDLYKCNRCDTQKLDLYKSYRASLDDPVQAFKRGDSGSSLTLLMNAQSAGTVMSGSGLKSPTGFAVPRRVIPKTSPTESGGGAFDSVIPLRDHSDVAPDAKQIETPDEGDLNEWSHHLGVESCDDYVLRKASRCLVSFVYGQITDGAGLARMAQLKAQKAADQKAKIATTKMEVGVGGSLRAAEVKADENHAEQVAKKFNTCAKPTKMLSLTSMKEKVMSSPSDEEDESNEEEDTSEEEDEEQVSRENQDVNIQTSASTTNPVSSSRKRVVVMDDDDDFE